MDFNYQLNFLRIITILFIFFNKVLLPQKSIFLPLSYPKQNLV
jgi:hypothetical protein